jgi:hypothetical protein
LAIELSAGVEVVTPTTLSSTSNKRVEIQPKRNEKHNKNSEIKKDSKCQRH